jgi:phosphohistidine phosphatase
VKRLLLLRHAKAVPAGPGIDDHARALAERGRTDAPAMGRYMHKHDFVPELVLSSTAARTVETAQLAFGEYHKRPEVGLLEALYLAEPEAIIAIARRVPRKQDCVCIVGHNPGLEVCASVLARDPVRRKERDYIDAIEEKFPTCALAVLDFEVDAWRDIALGKGKLADFVRPKDL